MPKPPKTPPHSDLDGVDEDQVRNTDAAIAAGHDTKDLARAHREAAGRPARKDDKRVADDRSR